MSIGSRGKINILSALNKIQKYITSYE
jgi:hypothetical protein